MLMRPINKAVTAFHGCYCPGDMAVSMRKVLARPWVGVRVSRCLYGIYSMKLHRFRPVGSSPHRVRTHELIQNFLLRVRQSPSMDGKTKNKHVLCGFVSSYAQCCIFSQ